MVRSKPKKKRTSKAADVSGSRDGTLPGVPMDADAIRAMGERWEHDRASVRAAYAVARRALVSSVGVPDHPAPSGLTDAAKRVRDAAVAYEERSMESMSAEIAQAVARERIRLEFDALCAMQRVKSVEITSNQLVVTTHMLYAEFGDQWYKIGAWVIKIPRSGDTDSIRIKPTARGYQDWPHPHVNGDGVLCWGNVKKDAQKAYRDGEFDVLVQFLLAILTTGRGNEREWEFHDRIIRQQWEKVEKPGKLPKERQTPTDAMRDTYLQWCSSRLAEALQVSMAVLADAERALTDASGALRRVAAAVRAAERVQRFREALMARHDGCMAADFDALEAHPQVSAAALTPYGAVVLSKPLLVRAGETERPMGAFEIHLGWDGRVRIFNRDHRVWYRFARWDHPCVRQGEPLWNAADRTAALRAVAIGNMGEAVAACMEWLTTITGPVSVPLTKWPEEVQHA